MTITNIDARSARLAPLVLAAVFAITLAGCGLTGSRQEEADSGDPEADQRAEMRVKADEERGGRGGADGDGARAPATLYERLGGEEGITALVDDMTTRVVADPRVNFERRNITTNWIGSKRDPWDPNPENLDRFKRHMIEFITLAAGGPARYTGRDMRATHQGMKITNNEFDAMVGDIKTSMDALGMGTREKRDLLAIIETTRKQIVEKK